MKGLSHSSLLTPCAHALERNRPCRTQDWCFPNTDAQKEKQHPLRLGAWEVFFKLASTTWQMITSSRVIFFLLFSHVCLAWQELSCELMKHQGCSASQIGVVCFQERAWAGRPSAATNQLNPSDSSRECHRLTAAEDLAHSMLEQKYCFHFAESWTI